MTFCWVNTQGGRRAQGAVIQRYGNGTRLLGTPLWATPSLTDSCTTRTNSRSRVTRSERRPRERKTNAKDRHYAPREIAPCAVSLCPFNRRTYAAATKPKPSFGLPGRAHNKWPRRSETGGRAAPKQVVFSCRNMQSISGIHMKLSQRPVSAAACIRFCSAGFSARIRATLSRLTSLGSTAPHMTHSTKQVTYCSSRENDEFHSAHAPTMGSSAG